MSHYDVSIVPVGEAKVGIYEGIIRGPMGVEVFRSDPLPKDEATKETMEAFVAIRDGLQPGDVEMPIVKKHRRTKQERLHPQTEELFPA